MNKSIRLSFCIVALFLVRSLSYAQISLPKVFGDSMVLQRGMAIPVWGKASAGSLVIAELGTVRATAKAGKDGKWMLRFPKCNAGGPYTLKITESGKPNAGIALQGVLIGDVWLASGQSNMEWQVQQSQDARREIRSEERRVGKECR